MDNNEMFFVDILKIMPDNIDCYIQSPDLEDNIIKKMMSSTEYDYYQSIHLNGSNRDSFIERLKKETIVEYFQNVEIKKGSILLFEGYDRIEFGRISKTINIPVWFKEKYKEDWNYAISTDW
jgi:hypothetical protein